MTTPRGTSNLNLKTLIDNIMPEDEDPTAPSWSYTVTQEETDPTLTAITQLLNLSSESDTIVASVITKDDKNKDDKSGLIVAYACHDECVQRLFEEIKQAIGRYRTAGGCPE